MLNLFCAHVAYFIFSVLELSFVNDSTSSIRKLARSVGFIPLVIFFTPLHIFSFGSITLTYPSSLGFLSSDIFTVVTILSNLFHFDGAPQIKVNK